MTMKTTIGFKEFAILLVAFAPGGVAWSQCNPNGTETLAASVFG